MANAVDEVAKSIRGKQAFAVESFAKALRQIPTIIADNGGYDSIQMVQDLKVDILKGKLDSGLDMINGGVTSMKELGITESFRVKEQALMAACEAAELILRVDDVIRCAPRERTRA